MEPKKNPLYDVHRQRGVIFSISLALTLSLVIAAFKWSTPFPTPVRQPISQAEADDPIFYVPVIREKQKTSPSKRPIKLSRNSTNLIAVKGDDVDTSPLDIVMDQGDTTSFVAGAEGWDIPAELPDNTAPFLIVEKMPEPVGGWDAFYKTLQKNMQYPKLARRIGTSGKVYIQFTVNEKGGLDDLKIIKGIGAGCDEEALRVLKLTKWTAGKQRGRPVKVRMAQSIQFRIQ